MPWQIEDLDPETRAGLLLLGEAFARLRSSRGITQRGLANMVDLSQSSISRFEAGIAPGMRARRMARMLAVLRAGPDSLSLPRSMCMCPHAVRCPSGSTRWHGGTRSAAPAGDAPSGITRRDGQPTEEASSAPARDAPSGIKRIEHSRAPPLPSQRLLRSQPCGPLSRCSCLPCWSALR